MNNLFEMCRNLMANVEAAAPESLEQFGIDEKNWELLTQARPWIGREKEVAKNTLLQLLYGSLDVLGLPRFKVPAEYIAAHASFYCHQVNKMHCARFFETAALSSEISNGAQGEYEVVTAEKLFALMCSCDTGFTQSFRDKFVKRTKIMFEKTREE